MHSDLPTTFNSILPPRECVACTEEANLIRLVVSHGERQRLRQVTRGQLSSVIVWRATARRAVEGDWDLHRTGREGVSLLTLTPKHNSVQIKVDNQRGFYSKTTCN